MKTKWSLGFMDRYHRPDGPAGQRVSTILFIRPSGTIVTSLRFPLKLWPTNLRSGQGEELLN